MKMLILTDKDLIPGARPLEVDSYKSNGGTTIRNIQEADFVIMINGNAYEVIKNRLTGETGLDMIANISDLFQMISEKSK